MWVKLASIQYVFVNGRQETRYPGDWVDVGKQTARQWLALGYATIPDPVQAASLIDATAGIIARGTLADTMRTRINEVLPGLEVVECADDGDLDLPFSETLIWHTTAPLRLEMLPIGFKLLERWQVAVPLVDYETLAAQRGTDEERACTEAVIRDLRVPLRDTRLLFVRRCSDTLDLLAQWRDGMAAGDERLAFLRALYAVKPVVCDLPMEWISRGKGR